MHHIYAFTSLSSENEEFNVGQIHFLPGFFYLLKMEFLAKIYTIM